MREFAHVPTFASYIHSLFIYSFIQFRVIKMDPSSAQHRAAGRFWLSLEIKQKRGQLKSNVGENKAALQENPKLWVFAHPCRYL